MEYKQKAFTLAEILITLMIIGILAMATIPSLLQAFEERYFVSQLRKTYSALSEAYIKIRMDYGDDFYKNTAPGPVWKKYLSVVKDCGSAGLGCFAPNYMNLKGNANSLNINANAHYKLVLKDGSVVAFVATGNYGYAKYKDDGTMPPFVVVDLNGLKPPNATGRDIFMFIVGKERIIPFDWLVPSEMGSGYFTKYYCQKDSPDLRNGFSCTRWVLERGNQDYLKKDVDW